ncbi:MAG: DUF4007 family protein [Thermosediminibacteraceae bacterium]|nr:DUF4007 family protein [Thermosediminibacteraceae bacterium]
MGTSYKLKGHGSFYVREGWLRKGLKNIRKYGGNLFSRKDAVEILGVGANMVGAIKYWLLATGLVEYSSDKKSLKITPLGEMIDKYDPYFEDIFTLWLMHYKIATNKEFCTSWYLFFNEVDIKYFSKAELLEVLKSKFEDIFRPEKYSLKSLEDDGECIIKMYLDKAVDEVSPEDNLVSPFSRLGLLRLKDKKRGIYERVVPSFDAIHPLILLYAVLDFFGKTVINMNEEILHNRGISRIFNLDGYGVYRYMEVLERKNYVNIVRTAHLNTLYLNMKDKNQVLEEYYKDEAQG